MAEFSKALLDMLTEFTIVEIGSRSLDGITYTFVLENGDKREAELLKRYQTIKNEATKCGYNNNEVFRMWKAGNGYIFDMDIDTVKSITTKLSRSLKNEGYATPVEDIIKDGPDLRRKRDMVALSQFLKSEYDNGKRSVEVALFSKNSTDKIIVTGTNSKGEKLAVRYRAYALRHLDMEQVNKQFLMPAGFRISTLRPCEILPSKTGVSFRLTLQSLKDLENGQ